MAGSEAIRGITAKRGRFRLRAQGPLCRSWVHFKIKDLEMTIIIKKKEKLRHHTGHIRMVSHWFLPSMPTACRVQIIKKNLRISLDTKEQISESSGGNVKLWGLQLQATLPGLKVLQNLVCVQVQTTKGMGFFKSSIFMNMILSLWFFTHNLESDGKLKHKHECC